MPRRLPLFAVLLFALPLPLPLLAACKRDAPPPSPAASSAPAAARPWHGPPGALEAEGIHYIEHVTGGAQPGEPLPMIVGMHGRGGSPERFLRNFFESF